MESGLEGGEEREGGGEGKSRRAGLEDLEGLRWVSGGEGTRKGGVQGVRGVGDGQYGDQELGGKEEGKVVDMRSGRELENEIEGANFKWTA